jgi:hypothetical protein
LKTRYIALAIAVLLIAALAAGLVLLPRKDKVLTAEAIRNGKNGIVCEDALWLYENNKKLIAEKLELSEDNFSLLQEEFWDNTTPAQAALNSWHDEVITAIAQTARGNSETERIFSYEIGEDMLRIYQTAMAVHIGLAEEEPALAGIRESYCAE